MTQTFALTQTAHTFKAPLAFAAAQAFLASAGWPDWDIRFASQVRPTDGYTVEVYNLNGERIGFVAPGSANLADLSNADLLALWDNTSRIAPESARIETIFAERGMCIGYGRRNEPVLMTIASLRG